jgi:hypothetical protein
MYASRLFVCALGLALTGCGLRVPEIQELGDRVEGQRLVQAILTNITCELRDAVSDLREALPQGTFIDTWGVQTTLTLTHDETGAIAPGVLWTPPSPLSSVFSLGAGLNFSSAATRMNKINAYYLVSDLNKARCSEAARPNGPFLLQSDLKLSEWLFTAVSAAMKNTINFKTTTLVVKENVLQHEIKFAIITSGTLNPTWKLTRVTTNPSSSLFSAGRTRTHDLLITLGPASQAVVAETTKGGRRRMALVSQPTRQAADLHFSTLVASGIESALRSGFHQ